MNGTTVRAILLATVRENHLMMRVEHGFLECGFVLNVISKVEYETIEQRFRGEADDVITSLLKIDLVGRNDERLSKLEEYGLMTDVRG